MPFPGGGDSLAAFWKLLCDGVDAICEVPGDRWDVERHYDADLDAPGKMNTRWGGFLERVDGFDAAFFGVSPREAAQMDPQQRLILELAWEALEDARRAPHSLRGTRTGVFLGAMWSDYARLGSGALANVDPHTATGQDTSVLAGRFVFLNFPFSSDGEEARRRTELKIIEGQTQTEHPLRVAVFAFGETLDLQFFYYERQLPERHVEQLMAATCELLERLADSATERVGHVLSSIRKDSTSAM